MLSCLWFMPQKMHCQIESRRPEKGFRVCVYAPQFQQESPLELQLGVWPMEDIRSLFTSQQNNHNDICVFYFIKESAEGRKYISLKAPGNRQAFPGNENICDWFHAATIILYFFFFKGHTMGGAHTPAPKNVPKAKWSSTWQFVSQTVAVIASRHWTKS